MSVQTVEPFADYAAGGHPFVHPDATVHPTAVLCPGVYIGPRVTIGAGCFVGPNTMIGQPGFGYEPADETGNRRYRAHWEGVEIGDDVHIGAGVCIDQGRHRPTVLERGVRVDNLAHIAHNVHVGENSFVFALTMLAGTVQVGRDCHVGPCASVTDHVTIGDRARVGLGAVVIRDVPAGVIVVGNPARLLRERGPDE